MNNLRTPIYPINYNGYVILSTAYLSTDLNSLPPNRHHQLHTERRDMSKKNELVTIDSNELPVIEWQGVRVVTTETLAAGYGTEATNVRSNIANHRSRFIEGVHVFTLKGDDFRAFINQVNNIDLVNKHTNQVTLFTEIGDFIINEC